MPDEIPTVAASAAPDADWDCRETPRYRASRDVWPASQPYVKHVQPIPHMAELEDVWQYGRAPIAAGKVIATGEWPHESFEPLNESARRVHGFFLARIGKVWLSWRPWDGDHIVLDDGTSSTRQKVSTDSEVTPS